MSELTKPLNSHSRLEVMRGRIIRDQPLKVSTVQYLDHLGIRRAHISLVSRVLRER